MADKNSKHAFTTGNSSEAFSMMENLEARTFLSATSFSELQTPSLDVPINGSASITDTVETVSGEDYYCFVAPATGKISIEMTGDDTLDSYLELFKANGNKVKRIRKNNNADKTTTDSEITVNVKADQLYYIKADAFKSRSSGDYELTVTSEAKDDYSDQLEQADVAKVNRKGKGKAKGWVNYTSDVDLLKITATRDGYMEIEMAGQGKAALGSCHMSVINTSGQVLSVADGFGSSTAQMGFEVTAGQTYYVYASSGDDGVGKYKLNMDTSESTPNNGGGDDDNNGGGDDDNTGGDDPVVINGGFTPDQFSAGNVVSASYYNFEGADLLVVLGTDGSDWIEASYASGNILINNGFSVTAYDGNVDGLVLIGFGGNDYLRSDASVIINTGIYGGDGDDSLYDAGEGNAEISGGNGDDLIITIGGGSDVLVGNAGLDSFWADGSDNISDKSNAEKDADSVHVVTEFYQPYTTNKSNTNYVPLSLAGQDLKDPETTGIANRWVNYADSPLFVGAPSYNDIDQGGVGDCYFLSALAGYAHDDPQIIRQMVTDLGDGTYAVRFYRNGKAKYIRVDADLPMSNNNLAYANLGDNGETWVAIAEKAYAHFRYNDSDYGSISSGWMNVVYEEITNRDAALKWTSGMNSASLFSYVSSLLAEGDTVSAGSVSGGSGPIAGGHAYAVLGVETIDGVNYVTVHNPWGIDGRYYDDNYNDGVMTITAEQFKDAFVAVAVSYA